MNLYLYIVRALVNHKRFDCVEQKVCECFIIISNNSNNNNNHTIKHILTECRKYELQRLE